MIKRQVCLEGIHGIQMKIELCLNLGDDQGT